MSDEPSLRTVTLERTGKARYVVRNQRGGQLEVGTADRRPVHAGGVVPRRSRGCGAIDLDLITSKRAEPEQLRGRSEGYKIRDELRQPTGRAPRDLRSDLSSDRGRRRGRSIVPRTLEQIEQRLCTVSRTVSTGTPVNIKAGNLD